MNTNNLQREFKKAVSTLGFTQSGLIDDGIPTYQSNGTVCEQYANVYLDRDSTIRMSTQGGSECKIPPFKLSRTLILPDQFRGNKQEMFEDILHEMLWAMAATVREFKRFEDGKQKWCSDPTLWISKNGKP